MERGIIVMGVGRSGTSLVVCILHHLGVFMGHDLHPVNWEDGKVLRIHEAMIGRNWKQPQLNVTKGMAETYSKLIAKRQAKGLWGIKDPRLCFTFPALLPLLKGTDARIIFTSRSLENVVRSMCQQPGASSRAVMEQVAKHYVQALDQTRELVPTDWPTITIDYDDLVDDPLMHVPRIAELAGKPVTAKIIGIVDPGKRHHK
jgi:hypothetical protein